MRNLEVAAGDVYRTFRPLSLKALSALYALNPPDLKDLPFVPPCRRPRREPGRDICALIGQGNPAAHPFDSFQPVVDFLKNARATLR